MAEAKDNAYRVILIAAAVAIAAFLIRETVDADTWWQVGIGRDILENLSVPGVDRFSAAGWGRPYHDSHWLFQVLLAISDRVAGMTGVSIFTALLWSATFVVTYRALRRWLDPAIAATMLFVVAIACSDRFTPRPDIVTCLMIALFYRCLLDETQRSFRRMALLFMLQVVWANSHGLFVIGPFMAGCYLLAALPAFRDAPEKVRQSGMLFVLLLVASCLTPFGLNGWRYALLLATEAGAGAPEFFKRIAELAPTFSAASLRLADFWAYLLILVLAVAGCVPMIAGRRPDSGRFMLVVALGFAAFTGRRNMPLFVLAAAPFVAENFALFLKDRPPKKILVYAAAAAMLAAAFLPLSGKYYQWLGYPIRFGTGATPSYFPAGLPSVLKTAGFKGQIYNANYLGGFLLYHGYVPLTDGRWELYDPEELDRIFAAPLNGKALGYVLSRYSVTGILMQHAAAEAAPLLPWLAKDPGWRLVYLDHCASFWLRADQRSPLAVIDPTRPLTMNRSASRSEEYLMLGNFYRLVGSWDAAEAVARQGLSVGGKRKELLAFLGAAQRDAGRPVAAEATFRELLMEYPRSPEALNELAFFAYSRGDVASALHYLKRAAVVSPNDAAVRANIERIERGPGRR